MIDILFPYRVQLQIFQQGEYKVYKFLLWIFTHFSVRSLENKKQLVMTQKARGILYVALLLVIVLTGALLFLYGFVGFLLGVIFATQAYIFLALASLFLLPYEKYRKMKTILAAEKKLASFSKLKVIGVTGSYGKTSVKEFLYHMLKTKYAVLRTPESFNTPLGIAKVVDLELDDSYDFFVCEIGAYKRGDIKEICHMVHPTYGILTGINEQHIETFGSLENTTKGKFELIASLPNDGFGVVNGDNARIQNALSDYSQKIIPYGFSDKEFSITDITQASEGSEFVLILDRKKYKTKTKLLGKSNLQNILGAATMSYLLGMTPPEIVKAITVIEPISHRLEIKELGTMTLIDDAYNSNVDGFQEAIALLQSFDRPKIFVTPGIVDLGDRTLSIHENLGKLLDHIDYIILIGKSDRTRGLAMGITDKKKIIALDSIQHVWKKIDELQLGRPVVLLENDLPDNY